MLEIIYLLCLQGEFHLPLAQFESYSYDVDAVFDIGMTDYDSTVIFIDLPVAQEFLNLGNVAGVIQIFVINLRNR